MSNTDSPWYLKGPLKDWVVLVGLIVFFYVNTAGSNASNQEQMKTLSSDISDVKTTIKEIQHDSKIQMRDMELRLNKYELELELLKKNMELLNKK